MPEFMTTKLLCSAAIAALLLAGCGQKGPLYLESEVPPVETVKVVKKVPANRPAQTDSAPDSP